MVAIVKLPLRYFGSRVRSEFKELLHHPNDSAKLEFVTKIAD